jgi:hypothetical protein
MAKTKAAADPTELDGNVVTKRPTNELDALTFVDPLLRLVQQALGPFVVHRSTCEGEPCTCGLVAALTELQRREILVRRYGVND